MYKSDIRVALSQLDLTSGGFIAGLLHAIKESEGGIEVVLSALASNNDAKMREANAQFQELLKPILVWVESISPYAAINELSDLAKRFDTTQGLSPELQRLLRPGREALSELTGAYDVALQKNKKNPTLVPLIRPAIALEVAYAHYGALKKLYPDADEYAAAAETSASIELDGLSQLRAFSDFMTMLSKLVDIAETITAARTEVSSLSDSGIWISSIESGSPIKIVFRGSAKTIGLLLAMLKDLVRTPYLLWSKQGNLIQTMETYTMMRDLGIDDPIVVANVRDAIRKTSQRYSESFGDGSEMDLKINGETLSEARPLNQLALENPTPSKEDNGQKLLGTNHGDEEDESK